MKISKTKNRIVAHETLADAKAQDQHFVSGDLRTKIEKLAYELYEKRGCVPGYECEDWFKAEELVKKNSPSS